MKSRERGYPFVFVNQEAGYDTVKFENQDWLQEGTFTASTLAAL